MTRRIAKWCQQCAADRAAGPCVCEGGGRSNLQIKIMALLRKHGAPMTATELRLALAGPGRDKSVSSCLVVMQDRNLVKLAPVTLRPRFLRYEPVAPTGQAAIRQPPKPRNVAPMSYRSMLARGLA